MNRACSGERRLPGTAERGNLISLMELARQPYTRRHQCDGDEEGQAVHDHAVPVIVFLAIALIFGEAQQKYDVRLVPLDGTARRSGLTALGASTSEADDGVALIARLTRFGDQVRTPVLHHAWRRSIDRPPAHHIATNHFADFREVKKNPLPIGLTRSPRRSPTNVHHRG
jgi:hypothetical protein